MKNLVVSDLANGAGRVQVDSPATEAFLPVPSFDDRPVRGCTDLPEARCVASLSARTGWGRQPKAGFRPGILSCAVLVLLLITGAISPAQTVTLAWDPNPEPDVVGYRLYYGPISRSFTNSVDSVTNETKATVSGLTRGETYFFYVTASNDLGLESGQSTEIYYTVPGLFTNSPPTAVNATVRGWEDTAVEIMLAASDVDAQLLTYRVLSGPLRGRLSGEPPQLTYIPATNFFGTDRISFEVSDGFTNSAPATVLITVSPVNDWPTLDGLANLILSTNAGSQAVVLTGIGSGAGNESEPLTIAAVSSDPALIPEPTITYTSPGSDGLLLFTPQTNAVGSVRITVTVNDGQSENNAISRSFDVVIGVDSQPVFFMQAEAAVLRAPMTIATDTNAANGQYVYSTVSQQGTITFPIVLPRTADYRIWCRVLSTNGGTDSFFVSVDGEAEDIYDTAEGTWSPHWQWTQVNGRSSSGLRVPPLPRILTLNQGAHTLVFRGREAATPLDAICITADPSFVPSDNKATTPALPQLLPPVVSATGAVTVSFQAPATSRYEFQVSEDFQWWNTLWQSPAATQDDWIQFVDSEVTPSGRRFYRVLVLTN